MHHPCSFSKPVKIHIYVGLWGNIECGSENWGPKGYPHELPKNDEKGSKWPRSAGLDGQIVEPCPHQTRTTMHLCSGVRSPCNPKACHQCPISDVPDFCPHRTPIQEACNHRIDGKTETGHLYSMVKAMVSRSDFPNKTNPFLQIVPHFDVWVSSPWTGCAFPGSPPSAKTSPEKSQGYRNPWHPKLAYDPIVLTIRVTPTSQNSTPFPMKYNED